MKNVIDQKFSNNSEPEQPEIIFYGILFVKRFKILIQSYLRFDVVFFPRKQA